MHRSVASSVAGALVAFALFAPVASAASPPAAFVRVEGAGATLLAQTLVRTTSATKIKGNSCSGSSAVGALELATSGYWSGSYSTKFNDYLVSGILGETPTGNNFWTLWVNGRSSSTGGCETKLHAGDHELWFDCQADANFNCTNDPLALSAPVSVRLGRQVSAEVTQLDGSGHSTRRAGAAVSGTGIAGVSSADGSVRLVAHEAGVVMLQATKSGATPSDPVFVCVYARSRSECGSAGAAGPPVHVIGIAEHQQFALSQSPRELHGTAGPDPSGLTDVSLSLLRRAAHNHCSYYDGQRGSWHATSCQAASAPAFSVGASASWSYLLPRALPAGRYRLQVQAGDGAGRVTKLVTGVSRVDFSVGTVTKAAKLGGSVATISRAAPSVQMMVAGRTSTLQGARTVKLSSGQVAIGHRHCSVPAGTALAGLLGAALKIKVTDVAGCDPPSMFVTGIGSDSNHGIAGWQYKVNHRSPSFGAGDPGGRLRSGDQLLWFWCVRASACERTLDVTLTGNRVRVLGYDDNGHGKPVAGASVHLDGTLTTTGGDGTAVLTITPGKHTLYATKPGLVQSFPHRFTAVT